MSRNKDCQICKAFTPSQIIQLATPTYKARKERGEQKKSEAGSDATPTLVDPSDVTLLGRVSTDKPSSVESTPKQKKKRSDGSPRSSKCKHSSKPTSDDLKSPDDKWSERFSRLEAMLLNQSFAVPLRSVSTASVVPREHPFFDPGASTSVMFAESTGSGLAQTASVSSQLTATQPPLGVPGTSAVRDENGSATHPVQGPGTSDVATQPLQAPGAELATQDPQALGAGPEVLPTKPAGKVSVRLPVDEWLCRKFERLNVTVAEGYPSRNSETGGLLRDQFVKTPRSSKWYAMHTDKKDSASATVCDWSLEPAKLNSTFTRVARCSLPSAPACRSFSQDNAAMQDLSKGVFISMANLTLARQDSYLEFFVVG